MDDREERIRKRAHAIWEEEGRPEGREYSHWLRARAEEDEAGASGKTAAPPASEDRRPGKAPEKRGRD